MPWLKGDVDFLWGGYRDIVIDAELDALPPNFPDGKVWLRETPQGQDWMNRHLATHMGEYIKITSVALKQLKLATDESVGAPIIKDVHVASLVSMTGFCVA